MENDLVLGLVLLGVSLFLIFLGYIVFLEYMVGGHDDDQ